MLDIKLKRFVFPGKLFVFCGVDGSGKSTMIEMLREHLSQSYPDREVFFTKQPRELIRQTPLFRKMHHEPNPAIDYRAVVLLTLSERIQHAFEEIEPALRQGKIVISDRYIFSTIANLYARGYREERWFFEAIQHIQAPDVAFLADVPAELAIERIRSREEEKDIWLDHSLINALVEAYRQIAPAAPLIRLDTTQPAEKAFERAKALVDQSIAETQRVIV